MRKANNNYSSRQKAIHRLWSSTTFDLIRQKGRMTSASFLLTMKECSHLEVLLHQNANVFAWTHLDMLGIDPSMAAHKLNILPNMRPMRQKVRSFHPNRQKVIQMKIDKLLVVGFIKEATYPDWFANVVMVPKKRGTRWVCVDYTNLKDVYPKNSFLLPRIDKIVVLRLGIECSLS